MVKTKVIYQHTIVFIHRALNVWKEYQSAKYSGGPNIEVVLTYTRISNMWSSWNTSAELDKFDLLYFHLTITILTDAIFDVRGIARRDSYKYMCTTGRFAKSKATDRGIDVANAIVIYCQRTNKKMASSQIGIRTNGIYQIDRELTEWHQAYMIPPEMLETTKNNQELPYLSITNYSQIHDNRFLGVDDCTSLSPFGLYQVSKAYISIR